MLVIPTPKPAAGELLQEKLWIEAARKEPSAFKPLFDKYHDAIFNYALRRTSQASLAQDITANTFLKALDHLKDFRWQEISFSSWIYRIATNEINQHFRKTKRLVRLSPSMEAALQEEGSADSELLAFEERLARNAKYRRMHAGLSSLQLKYQTVLTLRFFENKSIKDIAEILALPVNTIKTHIRRGLTELRKRL